MRFFAAVLLAALGMVELVLRLAVMLVLVCTVIGAHLRDRRRVGCDSPDSAGSGSAGVR